MKSSQAPFRVARSGSAIYVRIEGLGSMHNAPTLETFAETAIREGARQFVLDLARCTGVDSTFMGLLLELHRQVNEGSGEGAPGIVLINADDHARKQLGSVGVDAFVTIKRESSELPRSLKLTELSVEAVSDRERLKVMMRTHKALVAADARNQAKFGPFLDAIVAELG